MVDRVLRFVLSSNRLEFTVIQGSLLAFPFKTIDGLFVAAVCADVDEKSFRTKTPGSDEPLTPVCVRVGVNQLFHPSNSFFGELRRSHLVVLDMYERPKREKIDPFTGRPSASA